MLSVWHKADIYRIPIYAPVTTLHQELIPPITTTNRTTKPDRNQLRAKDLTPGDKILKLAYKLHFFSHKNYLYPVLNAFLLDLWLLGRNP